MARIVPVGEPANDAERAVIAHLRDHGPADWTVLHNVEIARSPSELFEVDLVVATGHAVYVIDVKGTRGRIEVEGSQWYPSGRAPFRSPLPKLRANSRQLKGLLEQRDRRLHRLYTDALIVLPDRHAELLDNTPGRRDAASTVKLEDLIATLSDTTRVPAGRFDTDLTSAGLDDAVLRVLQGTVRKPSGPLRFGNWIVVERLSESERAPGVDVLNEYRARNAFSTAHGSGTVRLSVRAADPYLPMAERGLAQKKIAIAYEALGKLSSHPNIVGVKDFFAADDDESSFVTVYEDIPGHALRLHLTGTTTPLSADQKLRTLVGALQGLAYVHSPRSRIVHRAVSPSTILIASDGRALLTGFDYAKTASQRQVTVNVEAHHFTEWAYLAPECVADPSRMSFASDVYALGIVAFELFTGALPFASTSQRAESNGRLPEEELKDGGVRPELIHWMQLLCAPEPEARPTAQEALRRLKLAMGAAQQPAKRIVKGGAAPSTVAQPEAEPGGDTPRGPGFFRNLPSDFELGTKLLVRHRLGNPGSFGVAYKVFDTMRNVDRAVKLVLRDRDSTLERAKRESRILERLQGKPHPNVVTMFDVDLLPAPDRYPYLVFEFVDGKDISFLIAEGRLGPADVLRLGRDTARGLKHIHELGVWHCDIKPSNLLWTDEGVKLLDFGIAKTADSSEAHTHTTPRYSPPDLDEIPADAGGYVARDLYALGITMYEALTGGTYPWDKASFPPPGQPPLDPREAFSGFNKVSPELVAVILKAIAPKRSERFGSAAEMLEALDRISSARIEPQPAAAHTASELDEPAASQEDRPASAPNTNPFVAYLKTLYSQSSSSNRGTRGLDPSGFQVYVETAMDQRLLASLREGRHGLVVVTGNAGDGKTAFLEQLQRRAAVTSAVFGAPRPNGADFTWEGRAFRTNHDGSQDEADQDSDTVLDDFFGPYAGADESAWPTAHETRLIAINEGRLTDYLSHRADRFPRLRELLVAGLAGASAVSDTVTVVNLNTRDVTARQIGPMAGAGEKPAEDTSIVERMAEELALPGRWEACASCDLAQKCYARHNALTLAHPDAGRMVRGRLRRLYQVTQLRGDLHITLRDLRSALAYTLTSGRDCAEIHELYEKGTPEQRLERFYFSSYLGQAPDTDGRPQERDRLLALLREADVATMPQPQLDRRLDLEGVPVGALVAVDGRGSYDRELLATLQQQLSHGTSASPAQLAAHRAYVDAARRLMYFESLDDERADAMLPFPSTLRFLALLSDPQRAAGALGTVLEALNRGEGLADPRRLGDHLALQVRDVAHGTIRSYRLFPSTAFTLVPKAVRGGGYVESSPHALLLRYQDPELPGHRSELTIRLDLFELLDRFAHGYRPGAADSQGRQLSLSVFKNTLASVPYQEILLTAHGHDLHRISRRANGLLHMEELTTAAAPGDEGDEPSADAVKEEQ
ncbi:methylation-associated defense system protein kinase MAD6 [Streptomyces gibsoniae]|uniref:non-specific serine/threonine protein kinase n=1 Tax=Streptomyces gibsoniae TaxID=3075529 RepID=A0ABU2U6B7_9ACTN|nr:protein kinase [Streptomyces sp. DSM 41699]MDT0468733.1 protein kinase [Streptomyces sp. DSM 41699]